MGSAVGSGAQPVKVVGTAAVVVFLGLHLLAVFTCPPNPDEWQQLRNSYDLFMGEKLYVDFWDNHGPFLTYLQAPWFGVVPQDHVVLCLMRLPLWFVTIAVALFTALAAREAFPDRSVLPRLSALLVLMAPTYMAKAYEVRGDNILNALYVLALWLVLRGFRTNRPWLFLAAGLSCGLIWGLSIKVLFVGFAFLLIFTMRWWIERRIKVGPMLLFGLGNAIPFAATLAWLRAQTLLDGFFAAYFGHNLDRQHRIDIEPLTDLVLAYPVATLLSLTALWAGAARLRSGTAAPAEKLLWPAAVFLPFSYVFLLPTHHLQSLLSSHTLVAMFVALFVEEETRRVRATWKGYRRLPVQPTTLAAALLALVCLYHAGDMLLKMQSKSSRLRAMLESANVLMRLSKPNEMILDGRGLPLWRPKPLFARSLVNHIRGMYAAGRLDLDVPGHLRAKGVRFVVLDKRVSGLKHVLPWLAQHYLPMAPLPDVTDLVLVAGTITTAPSTTGTVSVTIPSQYWAETLPVRGGVVAVNGVQSGPWQLGVGRHEIQVREDVTTVILSAVPPAQLWNLDEIEQFDLMSTADSIRNSDFWNRTVRRYGESVSDRK